MLHIFGCYTACRCAVGLRHSYSTQMIDIMLLGCFCRYLIQVKSVLSFITGLFAPPLSITEASAIVYAIFQDQALTHSTCVKCIPHTCSSCLAYRAGFTNLDGELGTAHHFNDVEGRPADVIAQHLELQEQERKWIVRMLISEQHTAQYKQRLDDDCRVRHS